MSYGLLFYSLSFSNDPCSSWQQESCDCRLPRWPSEQRLNSTRDSEVILNPNVGQFRGVAWDTPVIHVQLRFRGFGEQTIIIREFTMNADIILMERSNGVREVMLNTNAWEVFTKPALEKTVQIKHTIWKKIFLSDAKGAAFVPYFHLNVQKAKMKTTHYAGMRKTLIYCLSFFSFFFFWDDIFSFQATTTKLRPSDRVCVLLRVLLIRRMIFVKLTINGLRLLAVFLNKSVLRRQSKKQHAFSEEPFILNDVRERGFEYTVRRGWSKDDCWRKMRFRASVSAVRRCCQVTIFQSDSHNLLQSPNHYYLNCLSQTKLYDHPETTC